MARLFDKPNQVARTIAGSASDDETDEDLAGLDRKQLQRLAERLGLHVGATLDEIRAAIRSIIEPATGSHRLH
jgi:hypothetical protein